MDINEVLNILSENELKSTIPLGLGIGGSHEINLEGTSFLFNYMKSNYILTARHCVDPIINKNEDSKI